MKKFLLLVFSLSVLAVLSACSDSGSGSSSNNGGGAQTPTLTADDLVGTYEVVSFKTTTSFVGANIIISTDCTGLGDGCSTATMYGSKFTVTKVGDNLVAESQMQMYSALMGSTSENDTYQYVKYASMPVSDFPQSTTTKTYTGVSGRNLTTLTSNPKSTFSFTMNADGTITNNLTLVDKEIVGGGKVNADTVVVLRKVSTTVDTPINSNSLIIPAEDITDTAAKAIFEKFVQNPAN